MKHRVLIFVFCNHDKKSKRVEREREREREDRNHEIGSERKKMKYLNVRLNYCAQPTRNLVIIHSDRKNILTKSIL